MTLHILFCPMQTIAADGGLFPTASLTLTLDDEVQYRCAGFVQAEIEKFAEGIDDGTGDANDDQSGTDGSDEDEAEERPPVKRKKIKEGKSKKVKEGATGSM
jgi:cohesin complex subunit SA-1/2